MEKQCAGIDLHHKKKRYIIIFFILLVLLGGVFFYEVVYDFLANPYMGHSLKNEWKWICFLGYVPLVIIVIAQLIKNNKIRGAISILMIDDMVSIPVLIIFWKNYLGLFWPVLTILLLWGIYKAMVKLNLVIDLGKDKTKNVLFFLVDFAIVMAWAFLNTCAICSYSGIWP
ncbi:MAG: hypothetical protein IKO10_06545 [Lachnospiraceae bacterium]|nr:hypothetical protein [Lachnospiraceae bacterium]